MARTGGCGRRSRSPYSRDEPEPRPGRDPDGAAPADLIRTTTRHEAEASGAATPHRRGLARRVRHAGQLAQGPETPPLPGRRVPARQRRCAAPRRLAAAGCRDRRRLSRQRPRGARADFARRRHHVPRASGRLPGAGARQRHPDRGPDHHLHGSHAARGFLVHGQRPDRRAHRRHHGVPHHRRHQHRPHGRHRPRRGRVVLPPLAEAHGSQQRRCRRTARPGLRDHPGRRARRADPAQRPADRLHALHLGLAGLRRVPPRQVGGPRAVDDVGRTGGHPPRCPCRHPGLPLVGEGAGLPDGLEPSG